jgi:adenylate cyclase
MNFILSETTKKRITTEIIRSTVALIAGLLFAGLLYIFTSETSGEEIEVYLLIGACMGFFSSLSIAATTYFLRDHVKSPPVAFTLFIQPIIMSFIIVINYTVIITLVLGEFNISDSYLPQTLTFSLAMAFILYSFELITRLIGPKAVLRLLTGKYHKPVLEKRFVMFLDIQDSTSIAESIGDQKFHGFLRDFFRDITNATLQKKAEIYKYVGDEVILTWKKKEGIKNHNVLDLVFQIKQDLELLSEKYNTRYSALPKFRTGLHFGDVLVGEMGEIKMEIAFLGDVMNTASRIQSACSSNNSDFLVSEEVIKQMKNLETSNFNILEIDTMPLKGKQQSVKLFSVTKS